MEDKVIKREKREKRIIYFKDEQNDEFSKAKIEPKVIDEAYNYCPNGFWWRSFSFVLQNIVTVPLKVLYAKIKFHHCLIGREKLKPYQKTGYFLYCNHTQPFGDTFLPSNMVYPKRNFFIVNPENVSMKGLQKLVPMLGAIPIPNRLNGMPNFLECIQKKIENKACITIYPEAHIWPYYTKIRPFKSVSFQYPIKLNTPTFCMTNTYQKRKNGKVQIVSYLDGPFYPKKSCTSFKEKQQDLRNQVYEQMVKRSKNSTIEVIEYQKIEES